MDVFAPAVIPLFIPHEGCPRRCVFCNQRHTRPAPPLTPEAARAEIELWLARLRHRTDQQPPELAFYGGSFTALPESRQEELLEAARPFLEAGRIRGIRLSTRPDAVDAACLDRLKARGVLLVELGVQSCDDAVLAAAGRGHDFAASLAASALVREAGLLLGWQLLLGLPGESRTGIRRMAAECLRARPDCVRLYPLVVLEGSALAADWRAGRFRPKSLGWAVVVCAWLKERFEAEGLAVIRTGLQAGEALEREILAGPWHPAFGELVAARLMFRRARRLLACPDRPPTQARRGACLLRAARRDMSCFTGRGRAVLRRLEDLAERGLIAPFRLAPDADMARGALRREDDA